MVNSLDYIKDANMQHIFNSYFEVLTNNSYSKYIGQEST